MLLSKIVCSLNAGETSLLVGIPHVYISGNRNCLDRSYLDGLLALGLSREATTAVSVSFFDGELLLPSPPPSVGGRPVVVVGGSPPPPESGSPSVKPLIRISSAVFRKD